MIHMKGVEEIFYQTRLIAVVFRKDIPLHEGVQFLTTPDNPFQIGMHLAPKGKIMQPHFHRLDHPLTVDTIEEILMIQSGVIVVTLYNKDGEVIEKKTLKAGDSILLMHEGHGVDIIEDAQIFEVKQGPYPGALNAKMYVKPQEKKV
jgi:hypothetical protein